MSKKTIIKLVLLAGFLFPNSSFCQSYYINTIAGNGYSGISGDGGSATAAAMTTPWDVTIDKWGNLFIADEGNNVVRKVTPTGIISTIAGNLVAGFSGDGGAATAAQLFHPYGVAVDTSGNLYIADNGNNRVRKVDLSGIISTLGGDGTFSSTGDGGAATAAGIMAPSDVATDRQGNVYVCGAGRNVRKINTATGIITAFAGNGTSGFGGDGGPATAARLNNPVCVNVDNIDNIYIVDQLNQRVRRVDGMGIITTVAGSGVSGYSGDMGPATAATFNNIWGIAIDKYGNIFLGDHYNNVIRKIDNSGTVSTIAGTSVAGFSGDNGPALAAMLSTTWGMCTDTAGKVYIADGGNNRIRELIYSTLPPITTAVMQTTAPDGIRIVPNPSHGKLVLKATGGTPESVSVDVVNMAGRIVSRVVLTPDKEASLSPEMPAGNYLLRYCLAGKVYTDRLTIE